MPDVTLTGLARAGMFKAQTHKTTLTVRHDSLKLHCIRDYEVSAADVVRLEPSQQELFYRGVNIVHTRRDLPRLLHFSHRDGLPAIEAALVEAGFGTDKMAPDAPSSKAGWVVLALLVFFAVSAIRALVPVQH